MQKIMFNDQCGLTKAVLEGRKTMTRRVIPQKLVEYILGEFRQEYYEGTLDWLDDKACIEQYLFIEHTEKLRYKTGDIVAVAQSYRDILNEGDDSHEELLDTLIQRYGLTPKSPVSWALKRYAVETLPAYRNKEFVYPDLTPNRILIANNKIEQLQDITNTDCMKEGIVKVCGLFGCQGVCERGDQLFFSSPRAAFAALIGKVCGRNTWNDNPWVIAHSFEKIK